MSTGYLLQVFNKTQYPFELAVHLDRADQWESASGKNPRDLQGVTVAAYGATKKYHGEVVSGTATFTLTFRSAKEGSVRVEVDAGQAANGGAQKGSLRITSIGGALGQFDVVQSQYDAQEGDSWRNLAIAILPRVNRHTWMSRLRDNLFLHQITLPGTHDSGTAVDEIWAKRRCQDLSIRQQLERGVRFLDIRLNKSRDLEIVHETSTTGLYFRKDCVQVVGEFLKNKGPQETVLVCIRSEHGTTDGFHDAILDELRKGLESVFPNQVDKHLFTGKTPGSLGTLRGKVVLVRRYWIDPNTNTHEEKGLDSGLGLEDFKAANKELKWPPNSDTFYELGEEKAMEQQPGGQPFVIQDWYDLQTRYMGSKIKLIEKYLTAARKELPAAWFMNFISCGTSARVANPRDFAEGDSNINAFLFTYLLTNTRGRYGTLPIDFVEEPDSLVDLIIDSNSALVKSQPSVPATPVPGEGVPLSVG